MTFPSPFPSLERAVDVPADLDEVEAAGGDSAFTVQAHGRAGVVGAHLGEGGSKGRCPESLVTTANMTVR